MFKIFVQTFNSYTNFIQNHLPNYVAKISGNGNAITGSTSFYQTNKGILVMTELQNVNDSFNFLGLKLKDTTCSASNENAANTTPNENPINEKVVELPPLLVSNNTAFSLILADNFTLNELPKFSVFVSSTPHSTDTLACGKIVRY